MTMIHINSTLTKSNLSTVLSEDCIQPNAVDLPLKEIYEITGDLVILNGKTKKHADRVKLTPNEEGLYILKGGKKYDVVFEPEVQIAEGEAGFLIQRSSLNRNGITVTSGLYDSGYNNIVGGMLHIPDGITLVIGENERLAQLLLFKSETVHLYDGDYNKKGLLN